MTTMPVLTVRQPWAGQILVGGKDVENRTWQCPAELIGREILVHAGKEVDKAVPRQSSLWDLAASRPAAFRTGGVVGGHEFAA